MDPRFLDNLIQAADKSELILVGAHRLKYALLQHQQQQLQQPFPYDAFTAGSLMSPDDPQSQESLSKQQQVSLFSDPSFLSLHKTFLKKFPEQPDPSKVSGMTPLLADCKLHLSELGPLYQIVKDISDFTASAVPLINQIPGLGAGGVSGALKFSFMRPLADVILRLLSNFFFLHLMNAEFANERKVLVSIYNVLYFVENRRSEESFSRIVNHLVQFEKVYCTLSEMFAPSAPAIMSLVKTLTEEYQQFGCVTVETMRKDSLYSLYEPWQDAKAEALFDEPRLRMLPFFNRYSQYVISAILCCPAEFIKLENHVEILKLVLQDHLLIPMFRASILNIPYEFEAMAKQLNSKPISKLKSLVSEHFAVALPKSSIVRANRRHFVLYSLRNLNHVVDVDILCQKFPLIVSLLQLAKEELQWYFFNNEKLVQETLAASKQKTSALSSVAVDLRVVELMYYVCELHILILAQSENIRRYYVDCIRNHNQTRFAPVGEEIVKTVSNRHEMDMTMRAMIEDFSNVSLGSHFERTRAGQMRITLAVQPDFGKLGNDYGISNFLSITAEMVTCAGFIDKLESIIDEACTLDFTLFFRGFLLSHYRDMVSSQSGTLEFCSIFPRLAIDFMYNVSPYYPNELEIIGAKAVLFAHNFFAAHAATITNVLGSLISANIELNSAISADQSLQFAPDRQNKKPTGRKNAKNAQIDKVVDLDPPVAVYGMERVMELAARVFAKYNELAVYDAIFSPVKYLKNAIRDQMKELVLKSVLDEQKYVDEDLPFSIKRPSQLLFEIPIYLNTLQTIGPFDLSRLVLDEILLFTTYDTSTKRKVCDQLKSILATMNTAKGGKSRKLTMDLSPDFATFYVAWYAELLRGKGINPDYIYSNVQRQIISPQHFFAQVYSSPVELRALCQLLGPHGIEFMDEVVVLDQVTQELRAIKSIIVANYELLQQIQKQLSMSVEDWKKLRQYDELIARTINIGFILTFRQCLLEALNDVFSAQLPFVSRILNESGRRFASDVNGNSEWFALDHLFGFVGGRSQMDSRLRRALTTGFCTDPNTDPNFLAVLPAVFSMVLRAISYSERMFYSVDRDCFDVNNFHLTTQTFGAIMRHLVPAVLTQNGTADMSVDKAKDFLRTSLQILSKFAQDRGYNSQIESAYMLWMKVADNIVAGFQHLNVEEIIPYSLLRLHTSSLSKKYGNRTGTALTTSNTQENAGGGSVANLISDPSQQEHATVETGAASAAAIIVNDTK